MRAWLRRVAQSRFRVSTRLYFSFGMAVALTVAASLVGWFSFQRVGDVQTRVNEGSVPEMAVAFRVAQFSGDLVAAGPRLTVATLAEIEQVSQSVDSTYAEFEQQLSFLDEGDMTRGQPQRVQGLGDSLRLNIEDIKSDRIKLFNLAARKAELQEDLAELRSEIDSVIVPALDDQFFYAMTGFRNVADPPTQRSVHLSEEELRRYRHLAELQANANIATQLLASAFGLSDASSLEPLRERFESSAGRIAINLSQLRESDAKTADKFDQLFMELFTLGGDQGGFNLRQAELELLAQQEDRLEHNRRIAFNLLDHVNQLVASAETSVGDATEASENAIFTGRVLLLAISALSICGALIIILWVGRVLMRRLARLSDWMRRMAGGNLEVTAEIEGRDEVADMASALEVFRRHALEVQRLNLVEEMASELQEKNDQLEVVLADLEKAQDQIVMREKLAALGELTAGVAHEIKNPLNFVKNFSEASGELIVELKEILEEIADDISDEQKSYVVEISEDLTANLERISSHGERANRIVTDMLSMGRDTGERQLVSINNLLQEHAQLAYHAARAHDSDFQLDLKYDLSPDVGEIEVIPRDLSRVFLNMVGNACDATDEKRRRISDETDKDAPATEPYSPTLWVSSERINEHIEIRIKDNGNGIPPEIADKIFNPFFTTKPTDRGTGLGLAISSDIVRQHGGTIKVNSEPGEYTEMHIILPTEAPPEAPAEASPEASPEPAVVPSEEPDMVADS